MPTSDTSGAGFEATIIADVVTGKLDVREAAAHLPEEAETDAEEPEPLEEDKADIADLTGDELEDEELLDA